MSRPLKLIASCLAAGIVAVLVGACGSQGITVSKSEGQVHEGAVLFAQRCSGCHTLSYAGTHGSAANVRTAQYNNGPNFNTRCERPLARVLYAIENGGFSGAIMPQNIVVGSDAVAVAKFVSTYAGRQEPKVPGVPPCNSASNPVGSVPTQAQLSSASAKTGGGTQASAAAGNKKIKGQPGGPAGGKASLPTGQGGGAPKNASPTP
jgi:mono/diheme cytochrome c family protein